MEDGPEFDTRDTGLFCHICKCAVAVVVIQNIAAVLGYVQVGEAVIVVIARDTTQAIERPKHAGLRGHIAESAVAVIPVESILRRDAALVEVAAIDEVNVLKTVAVKIGNADSGTGLLQDGGGSVVALQVNEVNPRRLGDVDELNGLPQQQTAQHQHYRGNAKAHTHPSLYPASCRRHPPRQDFQRSEYRRVRWPHR